MYSHTGSVPASTDQDRGVSVYAKLPMHSSRLGTQVATASAPGMQVLLEILLLMGIKEVVAQIDAEIVRLQQARALLASSSTPIRRKRGRNPINGTRPAKKKRNLTPEGRARIAEAVKRRWAKQKAIKSKAR